mmetsp:Transcript_105070/g.169266  ORF Transcript_105070/g.169266 Transcript_105070/m.169266 type:complete len:86 (-) Transcript_105070:406-663(-)
MAGVAVWCAVAVLLGAAESDEEARGQEASMWVLEDANVEDANVCILAEALEIVLLLLLRVCSRPLAPGAAGTLSTFFCLSCVMGP